MMVKKLIGLFLVFMLLCANGQLIYAFENNNNLNNSSKSFLNDVRQSFNDLNSNLRSFSDGVHEASELSLGVAFGTTVIVGPNEEYKNLKDAVEHSKPGDTLLLVQGNYTGEENTNINISHDLKIKTLVPFATWITYNNTDYSHEDFNNFVNNNSGNSDYIYNNSVEHRENATVLNGGGQQIFKVENGVNLELDGLFLVNGSSLKGGAIHNKGNLMINDSYFNGNEVLDNNIRDQEKGGGGAIYNEGNLKLSSTNFLRNIANDYSPGGAIYNTGNISQLEKCMFSYNSADNGGGAIYNKGKINSINKDMFMANTANSTTGRCGGAILDEGENSLSFKDAVFSFNSALTGGGGAIDSYSASLSFKNSTLTFNTAKTYGGSIRLLNGGSLDLNNLTFNYNVADHQGGSVYYTGGSFKSFDCDFTGNVAKNDGGGLYLASCENSQLQSNNFTLNIGDNGGAIYQDGGSLKLEDNTLMFNSANQTTSNGGAVYTKNGIFNLNNNTFDRNYAIGSGGAIYNQNSKGLINYTTLHENLAGNNGGALYNNHFNVSINNCSVYSNYAIGSGGSIYNNEGGTNFLVNQTLFGNNTANKDGGSICNLADSFFTYFSGFGSSKTVEGSGGALYNKGNNIIIELSDFQYNFAEEDGGGIYNNGDAIRTTNVNMTGNMAHGYGGGYYDESNHLQAELTNFKDNAAGKRGNDYYTESDKEALIIGTIIGLAVIMIVITIVSVFVPAAVGLYGAVGSGMYVAGFSAGACEAAVYGIQFLVAMVATGIFIGIEEAISSACPEFEEWSSEYWYVVTIILVICAVGTAFITSHIAGLFFTVPLGKLDIIPGVDVFGNITLSSFSMVADQIIDILNAAAGIVGNAGGRLAAIIGRIAKVLGFLVQYVHLDDWISGLVIAVNGSTSNKQ